jgi:hypothetical protein
MFPNLPAHSKSPAVILVFWNNPRDGDLFVVKHGESMPVRNYPRDLFYSTNIERKPEAQGSFSCIIFSF